MCGGVSEAGRGWRRRALWGGGGVRFGEVMNSRVSACRVLRINKSVRDATYAIRSVLTNCVFGIEAG